MESEMNDAEGSYRRGYYQGAWDVIQAVLPSLSHEDRLQLERWHTTDVHRWRYESTRKRGPDDHIGRAIMPPRTKLKLR
jgi:hypothetical protein